MRTNDESFLHVSFHDHGDTRSRRRRRAHFQEDHADRREGSVDQQTATVVGAYITAID